jgi:regulation of enolase protein 1 (concanavalin A-like superfamily)
LTEIRFSGLPAPFEWTEPAPSWSSGPDHLELGAGAVTDLFIDPASGSVTDNAPRMLMPVTGDFRLQALVMVDFRATFDAGVLLTWIDDRTWAKLCFERSPLGQPTVVSVVTRSLSDDANGPAVAGNQCWLRVSRTGRSWAFHFSVDSVRWDLVRTFALGGSPSLIGFEAQSPTGQGCTARFESIRFEPGGLADLRDGS